MKRFLIVLVLVGVSSSARVAAQESSIVATEEVSTRLNAEVWGELGFWTSHPQFVDETALTLQFGGGYRITPHFLIRAEWPMFWASGSINLPGFALHDAAFDTGNPTLSAYYVYETRDVLLLAGGSVNIPLAPSHTTIDGLGGGWASALHGTVDPWLWAAQYFALVGRAHVQTARPIADILILAGDVALAPMFWLGANPHDAAEFVVQTGATVGFQFTRQFSAGMRLWLVWTPTVDGDNTQVSLTPYFRGDFGRGFFDVSFTMNLDTPAGFAFDEAKFWGLRFAGGARF